MNVDLLRAGNLALAGPCVVCGVVIPPGRERYFCRQLLNNVNVGEFLVKLEVVPVQGVSLNSPICRCCLHFVTMADRAWVMVDESVGMLKMRREERISAEELDGPGPEAEVSSGPSVPSVEPPIESAQRPIRERRLVKSIQDAQASSSPQKNTGATANIAERRVLRRKPVEHTRDGSDVSTAKVTRATSRDARGNRKQCDVCELSFPYSSDADSDAFKRHLRNAHGVQPVVVVNGRPGGENEAMDDGGSDDFAATAEPALYSEPVDAAVPEDAPSTLLSVESVVSGNVDDRTCRVCGRQFQTRKYRLKHEKLYHPEASIFTEGEHGCSKCFKCFDTTANRDRHENMAHRNGPKNANGNASKVKSKIVKCKICGRLIRSAFLNRHIKQVHSATPPRASVSADSDGVAAEASSGYRCKVCGDVIKHKTNCKRHLRTWHGIGKVLKKYRLLELAFEEVTEKPPNVVDPLSGGRPPDEPRDYGTLKKAKIAVPEVHVCESCDQFFYSRAELLSHSSREHGVRTEDRPAVDGDGDDAVSSVSHSVSEDQSFASSSGAPGTGADTITFGCPLCAQRFPKKLKRKAHVEALHPEACWCCGSLHLVCREEEQAEGECASCARVVTHLNAHFVWRHKAKYCPACHAPFASHAGLAAHASVCTLRADGGQFQEAVDSEFQEPSGSQLQEPVASQFQETVQNDGLTASDDEPQSFTFHAKTENTVVCAFCPEVFPCESTLLEHVDQSHWACIKCPEVFDRKELFLEHLKTHSAAQAQPPR